MPPWPRREGALARLSNLTAAAAIATASAVGIIGLYIAKALPGHHAGATTTGTGGSSTGGTATAGTSGNTGNSGAGSSLNPPSAPTQRTQQPAPVTSGAS